MRRQDACECEHASHERGCDRMAVVLTMTDYGQFFLCRDCFADCIPHQKLAIVPLVSAVEDAEGEPALHELKEKTRDGVLSIGAASDRMKELLPAYERCDGFGCIVTPGGIVHDNTCSQARPKEVSR